MTVDGIRQCFRCVAINIKATEQCFPVYPSSIVSLDLGRLRDTLLAGFLLWCFVVLMKR